MSEGRPEPREQRQRGGRAGDYVAPVLEPRYSHKPRRRDSLTYFERFYLRWCVDLSKRRRHGDGWVPEIEEAPTNYQTPANDTEL